jgi:hypothetical protein
VYKKQYIKDSKGKEEKKRESTPGPVGPGGRHPEKKIINKIKD